MTLVLGASACGGGAGAGTGVASLSGGTATTVSAGKGDKKSFQDAMLAFARCMREHGADMPDPTFTDDGQGGKGVMIQAGGPGGSAPVDDATFKAASTACQPIMDKAQQDMPRPSAAEQAKMRDEVLAFARCMRDHGIDMPDPTFDADGGTKIVIGGGADSAGGGSTGSVPDGGPPKQDPKFEAASKACGQNSGFAIATKGAAG